MLTNLRLTQSLPGETIAAGLDRRNLSRLASV